MNLQQLRYLVAFADHGTVSAAAESIPVAQPAMSRALRALERSLGVTLLRTAGRGLELTPIATEVVEQARVVLREVDVINELLRDRVARPVARVATWSIVEEFFAAELSQAAAGTPQVSLSVIQIHDNDDGCELVRKGQAEFAIVEVGTSLNGLESHPLRAITLGLMTRADADLPDVVPLAELSRLPMIWFPANHERTSGLRKALEPSGITFNVVVETGSRTSWPSLVRNGFGVAPAALGMQAMPPDLVCRPTEPPLTLHPMLVHRRLVSSSPVQAFARRVLATIAPSAETTTSVTAEPPSVEWRS